jgi:hypothetical protein
MKSAELEKGEKVYSNVKSEKSIAGRITVFWCEKIGLD